MALKRSYFAWLLRALIASLLLIPIIFGHKGDLTTHPQCPWIEAQQDDAENRIEAEGEPRDVISPFFITVSPLFPNCDPAAETGKGKAENQQGIEEGTEFWPPLLGYRLKITDTLIAFFTAALFVATWRLWVSTRDLVTGAEKTAERQLRAYISHQDDCSVEWQMVADRRRFVAHTVVRNFGQTPAYRCKSTQQIDIFEDIDPSLSHGELEGDVIMGPSSNRHGSIPLTISNEDYTLVQKGQKFIFVWGRIEYVDAFGKDRFFEFYDCIAFVNGKWEYRPSNKPQRAN
jgi:hypothetical protein